MNGVRFVGGLLALSVAHCAAQMCFDDTKEIACKNCDFSLNKEDAENSAKDGYVSVLRKKTSTGPLSIDSFCVFFLWRVFGGYASKVVLAVVLVALHVEDDADGAYDRTLADVERGVQVASVLGSMLILNPFPIPNSTPSHQKKNKRTHTVRLRLA